MKRGLFTVVVILFITSVYAQKDTTVVLTEVEIAAKYSSPVSISGQMQSMRSIPQSVSVINPTRIKEMNLTTIDQAMQYATGVTTIANDYMRSHYKSRGYDMSVMNDGLPSYNSLALSQQLDLSFYDQVEVLRGPTGILQGVPDGYSLGGIINLVKKRPTEKMELRTSVSAGTWSNYRGEIDLSAPIDKKGSLKSRWVFFINDRDFFYDRSHLTKVGAYGVLEWKAAPFTLFSLSYAYQDSKGDVLYNGLPALRKTPDDNSRNHLPVARDFNPSPDWDNSSWETHEVLFKMNQRLVKNWDLSVKANWRAQRQKNKYAFAGTVTAVDSTSNYLRGYNNESVPRFAAAVDVTGKFKLFNQLQNVFIGFNFESFIDDKKYLSGYYKIKFGDPFLVPDFQVPYDNLNHSKMRVLQGGLYAQLRLALLRNLKVVLGGRLGSVYASMYDFAGSKWVEAIKEEYRFTPFVGVMYDPIDALTLYASYSNVFVPQTEKKEDGTMLNPRTGFQGEVGVKSGFLNDRLKGNLALFYIQDDGRAYKVSPAPAYVNGGRVENKGIDVEVSAYPYKGLELIAGYTYLDTKITKSSNGDEGLAFSPVEPEHSFKFMCAYRFDGGLLRGLSLGANVMYYSTSYASVLTPERNQTPYSLLNGFVSYELNSHVAFYFNLNNITDRVYYSRLGGNGDFFGDPRNFTLCMRCKF